MGGNQSSQLTPKRYKRYRSVAESKSTVAQARLHYTKGQLTLSVPIDDELIIATAQRILKKRFKRMTGPLNHVRHIKDFLMTHFLPKEQEVFACLFLDNQHQIIDFQELFYGSIDSANVYPREVVKAALACNASALIAVHNHPSGSNTPSKSDSAITEQLRQALSLVDITLLDHFIVGKDGLTSLAELGRM